MSLESLYKLSILINMIDRVSGPAAKINSAVGGTVSRIDEYSSRMASMARDGVTLMGTGYQIASATVAPVKATFETQDALAELSSLGIQNLGALEDAATRFTNTWAGTTKPQFLTAAYAIKSGIASLTDEGVAGYAALAGVTAKATKSTINEMTDLFATGYGIYKDYYSDLSDMQFGEIFSAGIADSVRAFKTSGSGMAQAISSLGGTATAARVPLEEQLSVLGMLQATMSGSEAGTKYTAFLGHAAKAGQELGLNFTDVNGQLKSMPEILGAIKGKFGEVLTAGDKLELQKAFGTIEAVKLIDLLYSKTGDLQTNIVSLYDTMGKGMRVTEEMANKINAPPGQSWTLLKQKMQSTLETVGNAMLPTFMELQEKIGGMADKLIDFTNKHPQLISNIMYAVGAFGVFLGILGALKFAIGGLGTVIMAGRKIWQAYKIALGGIKYAMFLVQYGAFLLKPALLALKGGFLGLIKPVIAFGAALLTNPITWIVLGVVALIAVLVLLYNKCEWFRNAVNAVWGSLKDGFLGVWNVLKGVFGNMKTAYEEHGGGIKGIAEGIMTGIKGIYEAGFGALDNITGGALSAMKAAYEEHGGGINGVVAAVSEAVGRLRDGLQSVPDSFLLLISSAVPFIGLPLLIIKHWDEVRTFFANLPENIKTAWDSLPMWFSEFFGNLGPQFMESGRRIMMTLVDGILSVASAPVDAIGGVFQKVRNLLPFSDAKEGPLSQLTLSGRRIFETINAGMEQSSNLPANTMSKAFEDVDGEAAAGYKPNAAVDSGTKTEKGTIIQQLILKVSLDDIDSLKKLKKLIQEIEDAKNGDYPNPDPQPIF